ncbi:small ribosomal subunit protein mS26 [Monosporozyma unispora]|nr:hypothetical protein C6P44_001716 [Kazachstania unispora]
MGKGIAKYGYKSGILPVTRNILKKPTTKQVDLIAKSKAPKPKGVPGEGYAEGVQHPVGSRRAPPKVEFIDVARLIQKTVPKSTKEIQINTAKKRDRLERAQLRQRYLTEALQNEESRILKRDELIKKKKEIEKLEHERELKLINQKKSSDLTIPSLEHIINQPLMRQRTIEEKKLLDMKRKYNRDLVEYKAKETKLRKLLELYYVSDEFIVTEEQLMKKLDNLIPLRKLPMSEETRKTNIENKLGDELFGSINGKPGLPVIKEYLNNEAESFAERVRTQNEELSGHNNQ